uniref:Dehydrogenase/reductase (SDR family) member 7Ca n=1 Tax=Oncorhynchus tshawytscha TaxID=74940 RepID=A0A8C8I4D1_ONCTS
MLLKMIFPLAFSRVWTQLVILCGKTWEKLEGFADNLTSAADPKLTFPPKLVLVDFGDMNSMPDVIVETLECYGCVDVLILNSSLKVKAPVQSTSLKMDKLVMDNNYFGPITVAKGLLPSMMSRRTGHVILVNSIQGKLAMPFRATCEFSHFPTDRSEFEYGISVSTVNHTFIISPPPGEKTKKSIWSIFSKQKVMGITPAEAASEILKILNSKKREVVMAHSLPKMAIYARSLFPNVFFAVMAAGVNNAAGDQLRPE